MCFLGHNDNDKAYNVAYVKNFETQIWANAQEKQTPCWRVDLSMKIKILTPDLRLLFLYTFKNNLK